MKKSKTKFLLTVALAVFCMTLMQCKGGVKCGPLEDPLTDADSDCLANSADNCPLVYNPNQQDTDEDGVGAACDQDDNDSTVGSSTDNSLSVELFSWDEMPSYVSPQENHSMSLMTTKKSDSCWYIVLGCNDQFLGILNGDLSDDYALNNPQTVFNSNDVPSLFNSLGFYGSPFTSCSAFNPDAPTPPVVYCENKSDGTQNIIGYLTENSSIDQAMPPCTTLSEWQIDVTACESDSN